MDNATSTFREYHEHRNLRLGRSTRQRASRPPFRSAAARFIAWRVQPHLQAIDPAEVEALQHAAQEFAAFWRRCCLHAREIRTRCAHRMRVTARPAIVFASAKLGKAQLRFCLRATVNALLAFGVTHMLAVPLHGQWAVLTAVAVIQMSIGGSLKAAVEYIIGTVGGVLYATVVATLVPPSTELSFALALALAIGPLSYAAAISPSLRVAPVTAVLVLMISTKFGETPIGLAYDRLLEVAIGLLVAVTVSFLVLPAPAHTLGLEFGCPGARADGAGAAGGHRGVCRSLEPAAEPATAGRGGRRGAQFRRGRYRGEARADRQSRAGSRSRRCWRAPCGGCAMMS